MEIHTVTNLYVGNLAPQTTEHQLKALFGAFGIVERITVLLDRETGLSQGFAFVEMPNSYEARSALDVLNGSIVDHREIQVSKARALSVVMGKT